MGSLQLVNAIGSGKLKNDVDLDKLVQHLNSYSLEYDPETFPGASLKILDGEATVTIFSSGSYSISGLDDIERMEEAKNVLARVLVEKEIIENPESEYFDIVNLVFKADLGFDINLDRVAVEDKSYELEYIPEQVPYLIIRSKDEDWVITLSSNGKMVINGVKDKDTALGAFEDINSHFKKNFGD